MRSLEERNKAVLRWATDHCAIPVVGANEMTRRALESNRASLEFHHDRISLIEKWISEIHGPLDVPKDACTAAADVNVKLKAGDLVEDNAGHRGFVWHNRCDSTLRIQWADGVRNRVDELHPTMGVHLLGRE